VPLNGDGCERVGTATVGTANETDPADESVQAAGTASLQLRLREFTTWLRAAGQTVSLTGGYLKRGACVYPCGAGR